MLRKRLGKILLLAMAAAMLAAFSNAAVTAVPAGVSVKMDGKPVQFDVPPQIVRGRVMVPLQAIADLAEAAVDWDATRRRITIARDANNIVLTVGSATAMQNGRRVFLDAPVALVGGRTLVPLRFVSESLGFGVKWDGRARRVLIFNRLDQLHLVGPVSPVTFPFLQIKDASTLDSIASETKVHIARTVDILRTQAITGDMHFAAMPTYVAANLYNRGVNLKLITVSVWGNLFIVGEGGAPVKSLTDLKGQRLIVPSRGDAPDLIFRYLAAGEGLDIAKDLQIEYVPSPLEAAALLAAGHARFAVLSEPAATSAILRAGQERRVLERLIDLRKVWGEVTGAGDRIPQAGIVALPAVAGRDDLIWAFQQAYLHGSDWAMENPQGMGVLAERWIDGVRAPAAVSALQYSGLRAVPAAEVRQELQFYFTRLQELEPEILGGKLPDAGFYWQPE